jgi:outer membrane receptor for Fe3+-dicitrate
VGQEDANLNGKLDAGEDANGNGVLNDNRRIFNTSALNKNGVTDALYFVELKDQPVASKPQTILSVGLTYRNQGWFAGFDVNHYARDFGLDGGTFIAVDAAKDPATGAYKVTKYSDQLPSRTVVDAQAGYRFDLSGLQINASVQVLNVFDKEYLADVDRFGVIPGYLRTFRFNLSTGI